MGVLYFGGPCNEDPIVHYKTHRAQYPLIKEYGINYTGLHMMI